MRNSRRKSSLRKLPVGQSRIKKELRDRKLTLFTPTPASIHLLASLRPSFIAAKRDPLRLLEAHTGRHLSLKLQDPSHLEEYHLIQHHHPVARQGALLNSISLLRLRMDGIQMTKLDLIGYWIILLPSFQTSYPTTVGTEYSTHAPRDQNGSCIRSCSTYYSFCPGNWHMTKRQSTTWG